LKTVRIPFDPVKEEGQKGSVFCFTMQP